MQTWQEIYHNLDPQESLTSNDPKIDKNLYINDFFDNVKDTLILNIQKNYKLLLSGHIGCGKSTFLNLLSENEEIKDQFHVVKYSIKDLLDINDVSHIDLLLTIIGQTLISISENEIDSQLKLLRDAEQLADRLNGLIEIITDEIKNDKTQYGASVSASFKRFKKIIKADFFLKYKHDHEIRNKIRTHYKAKITEFISLINFILLQIESAINKKIIVLIDDTDKTSPDKSKDIFYANGHHLAAIQTNILFAIDVSLATSSIYAAIKSKFNGEEFFPAIKIFEKEKNIPPTPSTEKNITMLIQLIRKRIAESFLEDDTLKLAITKSGGVIRELIRILRYAVFNAKGKINRDHIDYACIKVANEFNLYGRHTKILKNIADNPDYLSQEDSFQNEDIVIELLHMPVMFQYRNGNIKWYRPYPIFDDWLDKLYSKNVINETS